MAAGVAIAYTNNFSIAGETKPDYIISGGHFTALLVHYADVNHCCIFSISHQSCFVRCYYYFIRFALLAHQGAVISWSGR